MRKIIPREIIKAVPEIQSVILPIEWFDHLRDDWSVFSSLYHWMMETGGVPKDENKTLHNRTYVGEKLFNKLLAEERKRLSKKHKLKGDELERAVAFSDMNSGPKTEIAGLKIAGDVLLVVPELSRHALGAFSSKIFRDARQQTINKIRSKAAGATFYQWLRSQIERPDRVGDLARDAVTDEEFPKESNDFGEIRAAYNQAHEAIIGSLHQAWLEYIQQYPKRVVPAAWCSECGNKLQVKEALLAWSEEMLDELYILDQSCLARYQKFDRLASRPLEGITSVDLEELVEKEEMSELAVEKMKETLSLWAILPGEDQGLVYFIRSGTTQAIKIGFTAGRPEDRLKALQTAHSYKLELIATSRGTREHEKELHDRFRAYQLEGEWFKPHPELLAFISVLPVGSRGLSEGNNAVQ